MNTTTNKQDETLDDAKTRLNPYSLNESKIHKPLFAFNNGFEAGVRWQKEKDKVIIDKLIEALKNLCKVSERETANLIAWDGAISLDASIDRARDVIKKAETK